MLDTEHLYSYVFNLKYIIQPSTVTELVKEEQYVYTMTVTLDIILMGRTYPYNLKYTTQLLIAIELVREEQCKYTTIMDEEL